MIATMQRLMAPIHRRVMLMVSRAVLNVVSDGLTIQGLQVTALNGEVRDDVERFQQWGFTSVPLPGAEGVMVAVAGNHDHGIVIAVEDRRYRLLGLASGEVALYDDLGQKVHLTRTGIVVHSTHILLDAPLVETTLDLHVGGSIVAQGNITDSNATLPKSMAGMRTVFNAHTHHENNPTNGSTNQPDQQM
jgi:phage baseplate assembly protein V